MKDSAKYSKSKRADKFANSPTLPTIGFNEINA